MLPTGVAVLWPGSVCTGVRLCAAGKGVYGKGLIADSIEESDRLRTCAQLCDGHQNRN